ncbi:MAG: B12-binding domain-containing radical SAM protein [Lachnospiraceae bacterium]|nr:B12-binding domain-containing radical SAM protein [Lachnospiraceae bacterium]
MVGTHPTSTADETLRNYPGVDGIARKEYDFTIAKLAEIIQEYYKNAKSVDFDISSDKDIVKKGNRDDIQSGNDNSEKVNTDNVNNTDENVADTVYESSRRKLTKDLAALRGISYKDVLTGEIKHNADADYITDLDEIPLAAEFIKKHLDYKDYFFAAAEYPEIQIFTGRGCPCRCNFCVYPQTMHGHKYRLRSPQNVVSEFLYIAENFPEVKEIVIEDDTFTIDKKRVSEICNLLIDSGMSKRFKWLCNARVNTLDLETMKLMKKAGCRLVIPGIESGTQEILDNIKKGTTIEQVKEYIKNTKKAGLLVHACYMVGNQGETKETMQKTLELALDLNTDTAQFFPLIPYPGTEAYGWAKSNGYIKAGYSEYCREDGTHNSVLNLPNLSGEEMVKFCNDARKKYYLRPRYILHRLWTGLKDPNDLKRSLKAFGKFKNYLFK